MANLIDFRLGIWGISESGKTVYLVRLLKALEQQGWTYQALDQKSLDYYNENHRMIENGCFPEFTNTGAGKIEMYSYIIKYQDIKTNKILKQAELNFIDISGEMYENRDYLYDEEYKVTLDGKDLLIIDYFLSCHGILFLVDYWKDRDRYSKNKIAKAKLSQYQLLDDLFTRMQMRRKEIDNYLGKLEPYVAFAVTKVDHKDILKEIRQSGLSSIELVEKVLGNDANPHWFRKYFHVNLRDLEKQRPGGFHPIASDKHRCQFYSISAIGFYYDTNTREWKSGEYIESKKERDANKQNFNSYQKKEIYDPLGQSLGNGSSRDDIFDDDDIEKMFYKPSQPQIKQGVKLKPLNVVEPIEWFIDGIKKHKPTLPKIPNSKASAQSSQKE